MTDSADTEGSSGLPIEKLPPEVQLMIYLEAIEKSKRAGTRHVAETVHNIRRLSKTSMGLIERSGQVESFRQKIVPALNTAADMHKQLTNDDGSFPNDRWGFSGEVWEDGSPGFDKSRPAYHAEQIAQTAHLLSVPKQDEFVLNVVSIGNADSRSYARQPLETHFREFSETSRESLLVDAMTTIARHGLSDRAKERSAQFLYKASSQLTERESARLSIWKLHNPVVRSHLRNAERGDYEVYSMTYAAVDEHRAGRSDKLVLTGELDTSGAPQPGWGKHVPNPDTLDVAFAIVRDEVKAKNILDNRGDRNREGDASVRS